MEKKNNPDIRDEEEVPALEQAISIAYHLATFETVQKFNILLNEKKKDIPNMTDDEIEEFVSSVGVFYDPALTEQMINEWRQEAQQLTTEQKKTVGKVNKRQIEYVLKQLSMTGEIHNTEIFGAEQ